MSFLSVETGAVYIRISQGGVFSLENTSLRFKKLVLYSCTSKFMALNIAPHCRFLRSLRSVEMTVAGKRHCHWWLLHISFQLYTFARRNKSQRMRYKDS